MQTEPLITKFIAEVDNSSFDKGVKYARDTKKAIDSASLAKLILDTSKFEAELKKVQKELKQTTDKDVRIKLTVEENILKDQLREVKRELLNLRNVGDTTTSRLQAKFNSIKDSIGGLGGILGNAGGVVGQFGGALESVSGAFGTLGVAAVGGLAVGAVVGVMSEGYQEALKFEKGLAQVNTVANLNQQQLASLGGEIKGISASYGLAKDSLLEASFSIASAGVEASKIAPILELSAKASIASGESIQTNFNGVIGVVKAYNLQLEDSVKISNLFFKTNELGSATVGGLANAINGVTPIAKTAGLSLEELFAVYATGVGVIGSESEVTTQLQRTINAIIAPTAEGRKAMDALGINFDQNTIKTKGLAGAMQELLQKTNGNTEALRKVVGSSEALNFVLAFGDPLQKKFIENTEKMKNSTGSLDSAVEKMTQTQQFQLDVAGQRWDNFKIAVGDAVKSVIGFFFNLVDNISLLPAIMGNSFVQSLSEIAGFLGKVLNFFSNFGTSMTQLYNFIVTGAKVAGNNILIALYNGIAPIQGKLAGVFNGVIGLIEGLINKAIGGINKLTEGLNKIPGLNIGKIGDVSLGRVSSNFASESAGQLQKQNQALELGLKLQNSSLGLAKAINNENSLGTKLQNSANNLSKKASEQLKKDRLEAKSGSIKATEELKNKLKGGLQQQINKGLTDTSNPLGGGAGGGGGKDNSKKILDEKLKAIDIATAKEIEATKKSELSEQEKVKKIIKIYEDAEKQKQLLKDETNKTAENANKMELEQAKNIQKSYDDTKKLGVKAYEDIDGKIIQSVDTLIDYEKKQDDIEKKFTELAQKAKDAISEINNDLAGLGNDLKNDLGKQTADVVSGITKTAEEIKKTGQELRNELSSIGISAENLTNGEGLAGTNAENIDKLKQKISGLNQEIIALNPSQDNYGELLGDLKGKRDDLEGLQSKLEAFGVLWKERQLIGENLTQSQIDEAIALDKLSETEKILYENKKKRLELEEKKGIAQAFASSTLDNPNLTINTDAQGNLSGTFKNDKGEIQQITDFKNLEYARDLLNQQIKLQKELETIQTQKARELEILQGFYDKKTQFEKDYTSFFGEQIKQQEAMTQRLIDKQRELNALRAGGGEGDVPGTTNQTTNNVTQNNVIQSQVDFNIATRKITQSLK